jgi:hypothetical protein
MSTGRVLSTAAALVVLLFFFLPWVTVSCSEQEVDTLSGFDLAVGTEIDLGVGSEQLDPDFLIFVVPLAALVVLGLVFVSVIDVFPSSLAAAGQAAAATVGLLVLGYKWLDARSDTAEIDFVSFSIEIGVWGVVFGLVAIIIGAAVIRFEYARPAEIDPGEIPK